MMLGETVFMGIDRMINTQVRPLTVDDYHRMIETGIIHEGEHIELISGQIFNMAAKETRHTVANTELMSELLLLLGRKANTQIILPPRLVNLPHFPEISLDLTTIFPPRI